MPAPPNCNASNDKFVRKKVIVALYFLIGFVVKLRDLFFGLHIIFGTKSALRSVKTFFLFLYLFRYSLCKLWVAPPQSDIELKLHFGPPLLKLKVLNRTVKTFMFVFWAPQSKFLAMPMLPDATF